jgi:SAM-dependent methyltransferase
MYNIENTFNNWLALLRQKWGEVPGSSHYRLQSDELLKLDDKKLVQLWTNTKLQDTTGDRFPVRGWYHELYKDVLQSKRVMDFGSGFGIDGITFAQNGAHVTFVDIVEPNLDVLKRLCHLLNLKSVDFHYINDFSSLVSLGKNYDVIWCQGSLINAPFEIIRLEVHEIIKNLKTGGRWIELAYPKERWVREGYLPFDKWGEKTDGEKTPWVEWYDINKMKELFAPYKFDVILYFNFHNNDFNWFDLLVYK